jgi:hypothetical protein
MTSWEEVTGWVFVLCSSGVVGPLSSRTCFELPNLAELPTGWDFQRLGRKIREHMHPESLGDPRNGMWLLLEEFKSKTVLESS